MTVDDLEGEPSLASPDGNEAVREYDISELETIGTIYSEISCMKYGNCSAAANRCSRPSSICLFIKISSTLLDKTKLIADTLAVGSLQSHLVVKIEKRVV